MSEEVQRKHHFQLLSAAAGRDMNEEENPDSTVSGSNSDFSDENPGKNGDSDSSSDCCALLCALAIPGAIITVSIFGYIAWTNSCGSGPSNDRASGGSDSGSLARPENTPGPGPPSSEADNTTTNKNRPEPAKTLPSSDPNKAKPGDSPGPAPKKDPPESSVDLEEDIEEEEEDQEEIEDSNLPAVAAPLTVAKLGKKHKKQKKPVLGVVPPAQQEQKKPVLGVVPPPAQQPPAEQPQEQKKPVHPPPPPAQQPQEQKKPVHPRSPPPDTFPVFGFGSNGREQLIERVCQTPQQKAAGLFTAAGRLKGFTRKTRGFSGRWGNKGVADIAEDPDCVVRGTVAWMTTDQILELDKSEGCSRFPERVAENFSGHVYRRVELVDKVEVWFQGAEGEKPDCNSVGSQPDSVLASCLVYRKNWDAPNHPAKDTPGWKENACCREYYDRIRKNLTLYWEESAVDEELKDIAEKMEQAERSG